MNDPLRSLGVLGVVGGLASTGSVGVVLPELPLEVSLPRSDFLLPFSPFADKDGSVLDRSLTGSSLRGATTGLWSAVLEEGVSIFSLLLERKALLSRDLSVPVLSSLSESCFASGLDGFLRSRSRSFNVFLCLEACDTSSELPGLLESFSESILRVGLL